MSVQAWMWIGFNLFVLLMLALDLGVFHRKSHAVGVKEALAWSGVWIALALAFNAGIYFWRGGETALQFLTGYLIEKSLSVDNIFVFLLVFSFFGVPAALQHKVLFWGVLGALVMRAALIFAGAALMDRFHWIIYVFGGFLILTGIKMALQKETDVHPDRNPLVRLARKLFAVSPSYDGDRFLTRLADGRRAMTPLFLVLLAVEATDLIFAVDSIPAIFAVTSDPFIVYTSNVFAILGLRSLYFALAGIMGFFHYLKLGLALVLVLVGTKMTLAGVYKMPIGWALAAVAGIIGLSVAASLLWPPRDGRGEGVSPATPEGA